MAQEVLYHHGILGQKWGVRRYENEDGTLTAAGKARYGYKEAKQNYKKTLKTELKNNRFNTGFGVNNIQKLETSKKAVNDARYKMIDAKASYASSKEKNDNKAYKKELSVYRKEMSKGGLRGSAKDVYTGNYSTNLYNHISVTKGKEYADKVEKSLEKQLVTQLAGSAAVMAGTIAVELYLAKKY